MFRIRLFTGDARLLVECQGFWDVPTAHAFHEEVRAKLRSAAALGRPLRILSDVSDLAVQDSRVMAVQAETALLLQRAPTDRHAVVLQSALQRLQARRILGGCRYEMFATVEAAADWLEWPVDAMDRAPGQVAHRSMAPAGR